MKIKDIKLNHYSEKEDLMKKNMVKTYMNTSGWALPVYFHNHSNSNCVIISVTILCFHTKFYHAKTEEGFKFLNGRSDPAHSTKAFIYKADGSMHEIKPGVPFIIESQATNKTTK